MVTGAAFCLMFLYMSFAVFGFESGTALSTGSLTAKITSSENVACTYDAISPETEPEKVLYYGLHLQSKMMEQTKLDPQQSDSSSGGNLFLYANHVTDTHKAFRKALLELTKLRHAYETLKSLGISEDSVMMRAMNSVNESICNLLIAETNSDVDCSDDNIERKLALYFSIRDLLEVDDGKLSLEKMLNNADIYVIPELNEQQVSYSYWNGRVLKNCSSSADILSNDGILAAHAQFITRDGYLSSSSCHCCVHSVFDPHPKC